MQLYILAVKPARTVTIIPLVITINYLLLFIIRQVVNPNKDKYFGTISYSKGANEGKKYAWIFKAKEDIKDGGIERYDSVYELFKKTDKIGSWNVG